MSPGIGQSKNLFEKLFGKTCQVRRHVYARTSQCSIGAAPDRSGGRIWRLRLITLLVLLIYAVPGVTFAHPKIVRTEPPADAQLTASPARVRVVFDEEVEAAFSSLELYNAQQQQVDDGSGGRSAADPTTLELALPPLAPGIYTAVWQTVGSDGHQIKGNFAFTVLGGATTAVASTAIATTAALTESALVAPVAPVSLAQPPESAEPPAFLVAFLRTLMLLGALGSVGGLMLAAWVLHPALATVNTRETRLLVFRRWRLGLWISIGLLLVATPLFALVQTDGVAGSPTPANVWIYLTETRLGQALLARLMLALALVGLLALTPKLPARLGVIGWALSLGMLLTFALSGHAAAQRDALLPVPAVWAHLVATAVWVGGLLLLVAALPPLLRALPEKDRVNVLARLIARFSQIALVSVIILTATGVYGARLHLNTVSDLWLSDYGRTLTVKIVLFGGLIALGAYNMLIIRPRFMAWTQHAAEALVVTRWQTRFQWALRSEVALAVLVIGAAGFLTNTPPPEAPAQPIAAATPAIRTPQLPVATPRPTRTPVPSVPFATTQPVADLQVQLDVTPASLGENNVRVTVRDAAGMPIDVQKVVLTFEMTEMDMGVNEAEANAEGSGQYVVTQHWLSMVGEWRIRVKVRRTDADDVETEFMVPVGG